MSVCLSVYVWCIGSDVIVDLKKYDSSIVLSLSSSSCLPPLYYHCHRQHAFLHCIIIVVIMLSSIVLSLSSSSCLPPLYYHCRHHAFLHCIIIVIVIMPSSSPFYFFLAKNLFTNSQDLLFPFFFLLSSVSSLFSFLILLFTKICFISCCCGVPLLKTLGSPGIRNCTLTDAFHGVRGLRVWTVFFYYPYQWAKLAFMSDTCAITHCSLVLRTL